MKKYLGPIFGALLAISLPGAATAQDAPKATGAATVNPASLALARQILTVAFPPERREAMYARVMNSIVTQVRASMEKAHPSGDKEFDALVDREMHHMVDEMQQIVDAHIPDYFEGMARAYSRSFSPDELKQILAFAQTPTGQRYFQRSTTLVQDSDVAAANQRMMADMQAKLPEMTRQMMEDVKAYVAKKDEKKQSSVLEPVN